jgi:hypothetical protein
MANVLTNLGRELIARAVNQAGSGIGSTVPSFSGYGTGAGTAAAADTDLFTAAQARVSGTASIQNGASTNNVFRVVAQHTADAARAVTNAGLFDAAGTGVPPTGGNLFVKADFATINLANGDTLTLTYNVEIT